MATRTETGADSDLTTSALDFARQSHLGQRRKQTFEPFIEHPTAVARLIAECGGGDGLLAAAYLHDVLEKTPVETEEIGERFGPEVAEIVEVLSDDPAIEAYGERKRALRRRVLAAGEGPRLIYAADRVANMRDWRAIAPEDREACAARLGTTLAERLELWQEDLAELMAADPEIVFLPEIEANLRALREGLPA